MTFGPLIQSALVAGLVTFVAGIALVGVLKRSRTLLIVAGAGVVAVFASTQRFPIDAPPMVRTVVAYSLIAGAFAVIAVGLIQQPVAVAKRLRFIHRIEEWDFDGELSRLVREFNRILDLAHETQPEGDRRAALRAEAQGILDKLGKTSPPTAAWHHVANAYGRLIALHLEAFGEPLTDDQLGEFARVEAEVTAEREQLREAYRQRARALFRWP